MSQLAETLSGGRPQRISAAGRGPGRQAYWTLYLARFGKALLGICGTSVIWMLAVTTELGQIVDNFMMEALAPWSDGLGGIDQIVLWLVGETMIIAVGILSFAIVGWRRRWMLGWRSLAALLLTVITVQILKRDILTRPDLGITYDLPNSFPSGHTAGAVAVAVALIIAVSPYWRADFALAGGAWVSLVGIATVINSWHRPSDVIAAIIIAGTFALLFTPIEVSRRPQSRKANRIMRLLGVGGWLLLVVGVLATLVLTYRLAYSIPAVTSQHLVAWMENYAQVALVERSLAQIGVVSATSGTCFLVLRAIVKLAR
ncbi:phosphatase PAP2 family protein [Boudabousia marimammalium]|uniref:Phosphatidic acid phosphatase type 2/haloperoxidase domain-containing protein n=1 Tax=Boudabousia marimammalium TaxID=156892 RepID=A0A1Q5PMA0_9ACTO|nr:phosphatase PAP2 family protein [Boudabousia marimammalium]OKL48652.1 hypothetical protein BM477_05475 [Boudabousia marimammalium]